MSRRLTLGTPPMSGTMEQKMEYVLRALKKIDTASYDINAFDVFDGWTVDNLTNNDARLFDADTVTVAELADVVGTIIADMKKRGAKRV